MPEETTLTDDEIRTEPTWAATPAATADVDGDDTDSDTDDSDTGDDSDSDTFDAS